MFRRLAAHRWPTAARRLPFTTDAAPRSALTLEQAHEYLNRRVAELRSAPEFERVARMPDADVATKWGAAVMLGLRSAARLAADYGFPSDQAGVSAINQALWALARADPALRALVTQPVLVMVERAFGFRPAGVLGADELRRVAAAVTPAFDDPAFLAEVDRLAADPAADLGERRRRLMPLIVRHQLAALRPFGLDSPQGWVTLMCSFQVFVASSGPEDQTFLAELLEKQSALFARLNPAPAGP